MRSLIVALVLIVVSSPLSAQGQPHVVFLVGESEYGSGQTMPAFARRLEQELGLRTTVLRSEGQGLPPLDELESADLLVMFLRFRTATDAQFARLQQWFDAGKPCVALRTTSHAFVEDKGWFPPFFGGHYKAHAPNGKARPASCQSESKIMSCSGGWRWSARWVTGGHTTRNRWPMPRR
mgnify:CR=1 FL=1